MTKERKPNLIFDFEGKLENKIQKMTVFDKHIYIPHHTVYQWKSKLNKVVVFVFELKINLILKLLQKANLKVVFRKFNE